MQSEQDGLASSFLIPPLDLDDIWVTFAMLQQTVLPVIVQL